MRRRLLLLLPISLLTNIMASAQQRSFDDALYIARQQAAKLGVVMDQQATYRAKARYARAKASKAAKDVGYYVFDNGNNMGFTIVAGDERMPDIVGYADKGYYQESCMPENLANFLKQYDATVEAVRNGDRIATSNVAEAKRLQQMRNAGEAVAPLLGEIKWNQNSPFNNMCPKYNGSQRSATGCVATAMSQIMAYWQWPKELKADIPAYTTMSYEISIPAISKGETYDWANMLPNYKSKYSQVQVDAVAKLMAHCGAAVQMDYGPSSGAVVTPDVLATYFGYDGDFMMSVARYQFTLAEWTAIIDRELEAKRPVLYGGLSSGGDHQFVCDGSDGNGLYHINWGWGGNQDGYFDINILNPNKGGIGSGSGTDGYNRSCNMIVGIRPDNGVADMPVVELTPIAVEKWGDDNHTATITKDTRSDATDKFSMTINERFCNQLGATFNGKLALGIKNEDGSYTAISNVVADAEIDADKSKYDDFNIDYAFKAGDTTTVYGLYSIDGSTWQRCSYNYVRPLMFAATDTKLTLVPTPLAATLKADDGKLQSNASNSFTLTLTNNSDDELTGLVNIYTASTKEKPKYNADDIQVFIPPHSSIERTFRIWTKKNDADLYIWIADEVTNAILVDAQHYTISTTSGIEGVANYASGYEVYNIAGNKVANVKADAGGEKRIPVDAGLYIVNGKKIVVR